MFSSIVDFSPFVVKCAKKDDMLFSLASDLFFFCSSITELSVLKCYQKGRKALAATIGSFSYSLPRKVCSLLFSVCYHRS